MCIIAIYKKGTKPTEEILNRMIKANPDGVGVAWNDGRAVHFRKGLQTSAEVLDLFESVKDVFNTFIFHARIATSGGVSAEKCHPFLIADNDNALNLTKYDGKRPCAFHNGVFHISIEKGLNDTQTLIKTMVEPLRKVAPNALQNGDFDAIIREITNGSRFAILYPDRVRCFGFWQEDNGVYYSNGGFREPIKPLYSWTPKSYKHYYGFGEEVW